MFEYIREVLSDFQPSVAHFLIPKFRWRAIATTNYDTLIDQAYARTPNRYQTIITFLKDSDPVEERLQNVEDPVQYLKLHGCLDHVNDDDIPLIMSHEHYSKFDKHRRNLYSRMRALAHESTFLFCGYTLNDAHVRKVIYDLAEDGIRRPRWFLVAPNVSEDDSIFWSSLNIQVIKATFGHFMTSLDSCIPELHRKLTVKELSREQPIRARFTTQEETPERLVSSLERDLLYIRSDMPVEPQDPKEFYQGFDTGWGVVAQDLDVKRKPVEDLLLDAVIEQPTASTPQLFVFTGPAGAGKTIALKRAAWEAATSLNAMCLWLLDGGVLDEEAILELNRLTDERVFLFVDRLALRIENVSRLLRVLKQKSVPLTVVASERQNEFNLYGDPLFDICQVTEIPIPNLSIPEIGKLLDLLTRHKALGVLEGESRDSQTKAFADKAERQLLVALHEATLGKPFEEIVHDEYLRIVPETAQQLYLDICTMHQYDAPARAGTISRISGIEFEDFSRDFIKPLEKIVITSTDPYTGDYQYRARHARIAQLVFQQAKDNDQGRSEQLIRILSSLDIGYSVDRKSLEGIIRGHNLANDIRDPEFARDIFRTAIRIAPGLAFVLQQWAIFETNHQQGSMEEADRLIREALTREPKSNSIKHSHAVICRKRANQSNSPLAKTQFRRLARDRLDEMRARTDPYVLVLRIQISIDELKELANSLEDPPTDPALAIFKDAVIRTENVVSQALQLLPDDAEILQEVARLNALLSRHEHAIAALERSWQAGPRGSRVAVQLANHYYSRNDEEKSIAILEAALVREPSDYKAHLEMAKYLVRVGSDSRASINQHFMRSYAPNDQRFDARHLHAQYLFFIGRSKESKELFSEIDDTAPVGFRRRASKTDSVISRRLQRYNGIVVTCKATIAFIKCPQYPTDIFAHASDTKQEIWRTLRKGDGVSFKVGFNRAGPVATRIEHLGSEDS